MKSKRGENVPGGRNRAGCIKAQDEGQRGGIGAGEMARGQIIQDL